jgi:hypothetical protein
VSAYQISKLVHELVVHPENIPRYQRDPVAVMQEYGLNEPERQMIMAGDWEGLLRYGVHPVSLMGLRALVNPMTPPPERSAGQ